MLCLLLEDGSLRIYFYGEDRGNEQQREEGCEDGEEKRCSQESPSFSSTHDSGDVLFFEDCSEVTEKCSIYGEFHAVKGNDEDSVSSVKESLIKEDLNAQIQSARANSIR